MKNTFTGLLVLCLCLGGCGKKKTPDEAANELFVEAVELVNNAKSEASTNIPAAIKSYEQALVKVRKITSEYKESDIAVKLVSGETLFTGRSIEQIEDRVGELKYELERRAEEARLAEEARQADKARRAKEGKLQAKEEEKQRAEAKAQHDLILRSIRQLNADFFNAFIQSPNINMNTLRVQMTEEGLVLEFFNDPSRRLFDDGKSELTNYGKALFDIVAWTLARHDGELTSSSTEVEGHTGVNFKETQDDDKWSISTKRALEVRRHMETKGVKERQFGEIAGYGSAQSLKGQKDPNHPHHSRVTITVKSRYVPEDQAKTQKVAIKGNSLKHIRQLNEDLVKAFVQNPAYIDMKTLRVQMTNEGLLLEFFNDPSRRLFGEGGAELTGYGKLLFGIVAWTLAKHDASTTTSIEMEGHTGRNFKPKTDDKDDDHWSISTERALVVRKHMENEGVKEAQFHKMVGFGGTRPLKDQPNLDHAYHSRVSIRVRAKGVPLKKN